MKYLWLILILFSFGFCSSETDENPEPKIDYIFESFYDFKSELIKLSNLTSEIEREALLSELWNSLISLHQIPFTFGDSVAFLYKGDANSVNWAGDFNGWDPNTSGYQGSKVGFSSIWMIEKEFPSNARLDYKIVVNSNWILDPANESTQMSGFGPNSVLYMPHYVSPWETLTIFGSPQGFLTNNIQIQSSNMGYKLQYSVYTPERYDTLTNLPVIYVTDGHEYADNEKGSMLIVLDNLISSGIIEPVIAVFIDPRNPDDLSQNRRMDEYTANSNFANFVADELVPVIDANYRTNTSADARAILGTSLGGWNSAYFGYTRSDIFHLIGIHSPAFDDAIIQNYSNSEKLPLQIYMSTGVIFDTQDQARSMKSVLENKGYPLQYKEVNEGHSWGNWRALIDEPLIYFFGK